MGAKHGDELMDFFIYLVCFGVGLVFTLASAVLGHLFGGDADGGDVGTGGHAEAGFEHAGMPGISAFSPTTIASFITAAGGFGMIFSQFKATSPTYISAPLSVLGGTAVAAGVLAVFAKVFHSTQSSSESHVRSLIGQTANIITPIPENGVGEIAYVQAGTRYTAPARNQAGGRLECNQPVKIVAIVGSQFYVNPLEHERKQGVADH
jgi:membrane-bound ClpP family serine protease